MILSLHELSCLMPHNKAVKNCSDNFHSSSVTQINIVLSTLKRFDKFPEDWKTISPLECEDGEFSCFLFRQTKEAVGHKQIAHRELEFVPE